MNWLHLHMVAPSPLLDLKRFFLINLSDPRNISCSLDHERMPPSGNVQYRCSCPLMFRSSERCFAAKKAGITTTLWNNFYSAVGRTKWWTINEKSATRCLYLLYRNEENMGKESQNIKNRLWTWRESNYFSLYVHCTMYIV